MKRIAYRASVNINSWFIFRSFLSLSSIGLRMASPGSGRCCVPSLWANSSSISGNPYIISRPLRAGLALPIRLPPITPLCCHFPPWCHHAELRSELDPSGPAQFAQRRKRLGCSTARRPPSPPSVRRSLPHQCVSDSPRVKDRPAPPPPRFCIPVCIRVRPPVQYHIQQTGLSEQSSSAGGGGGIGKRHCQCGRTPVVGRSTTSPILLHPVSCARQSGG
jgi:hypothetical protein